MVRTSLVPAIILTLCLFGTTDIPSNATTADVRQGKAPEASARPAAGKSAKKRVDAFGDPLPDGALLRLGTVRWRHEENAESIAYSPDGKILAATSINGWVFLWDAATGKLNRRIRVTQKKGNILYPRGVNALAFSPDGKLLAARGWHVVHFWEVGTCRLLKQVVVSDPPVPARAVIRFSPDGKHLATIGVDKSINVVLFDVGSGKKIRALKGTNAWISDFAFSPDGHTIAAAVFNSVYVWDTKNGKLLRKFKADKGSISAVAFSGDGQMLAADGDDRITVWDIATGKEVTFLADKKQSVRRLAFTPDGKMLISGNSDGKARVWDIAARKIRFKLDSRIQYRHSMALSDDGKKVAMGTLYSAIYQWDVATGKELFPHLTNGHDAPVHSVVYSPDGKLIATGGANRKIFLWDANTGKNLRQLKGNSAKVVAFSPSGQRLASIWPWNKAVRIWDVATGKEILKLAHDDASTVPSIAYAPDGKTLVSISWKRLIQYNYGKTTVHVWDASSGRQLRRFSLTNVWPRALCVSSDGRMAAVAGYHGIIWLCDLQAGKVTLSMRGHRCSIQALAFSPDGRMLISGSVDQSVRLWEVASGMEVFALKGHKRAVTALAFSPKGRLIVSGGSANRFPVNATNSWRIRLWDAFTAKELGQVSGYDSDVSSLAFSPDGKRLVSGLSNSTALVWDLHGKIRAEKSTQKLSPKQLKKLWDDLAGRADKAFPSIALFSSDPKNTIAFLKKQVSPTAKAEPKQVNKWISDLDSNSFAARTKAAQNLNMLDQRAAPFLTKALKANPPLETYMRLNKILETVRGAPPPDILRELRAVQALERIGTTQARELLLSLANGAPHSRITRAAAAALKRLATK